jgi:hypothetical protein
MRNCEVYAYIERLYDALHSGLPDGDVIDETLGVVMEFEDEVNKKMLAEEEQKSGIESNRFFNELAVSTDEEIIEFCERMEQVHPTLGKFAEYLMEEDDPTFFIAYGEDSPSLTGRSSDKWAYETASLIRHRLISGGSLSDK